MQRPNVKDAPHDATAVLENQSGAQAFDRYHLLQLLKRFKQYQQLRVAEIRNRLIPSRRTIFDALPLLLHCNRPSLPGYMPDSPVGIYNFKPSRLNIRAVQQLCPAAKIPTPALYDDQIDAIYLMGSAGSIAQTRTSDIDLWACVAIDQVAAMQRKIDALAKWASEYGLELQGFSVHERQFSNSGASSPLLLDEFYRSACIVAGRCPLWWLIPPDVSASDYNQYADRLCQNKYISSADFVDFGPVRQANIQELLNAGLRELTQAFLTPYKSLLKLALIESYEGGYPYLSSTYKQSIVAAQDNDQFDTDGYVMLGKHLQAAFADTSAWPFLRKAWLIKTSRGNAYLTLSSAWEKILHSWSVTDEQVDQLRWHQHWPIHKLLLEHESVATQIDAALQFLTELHQRLIQTGQTPENSAQALRQLRKMQHSELTTKESGRMLPALLPQQHKGHAKLVRPSHERDAWQLVEGATTLYEHPQLLGILIWLARQGLSCQSLDPDPADRLTIANMFNAIQCAAADPRPTIFVNVETPLGTGPLVVADNIVTQQDDPLSYSKQHHNLICTLDLVQQTRPQRQYDSSASSLQLNHYADLVAAIPSLLSSSGPQFTFANLGDFGSSRLTRRLDALLDNMRRSLNHGRIYVCQISRSICVVQRKAGKIHTRRFSSGLEFVTSYQSSLTLMDFDHPQHNTLRIHAHALIIIPARDNVTLLLFESGKLSRYTYKTGATLPLTQSLTQFCALLAKRGIPTPKLYTYCPQADTRADFDQCLVEISATQTNVGVDDQTSIRQLNHGWRISCSKQSWDCEELNDTTLGKIAAYSSEYITNLWIMQPSFATHLQTKTAVENTLSRLASEITGTSSNAA